MRDGYDWLLYWVNLAAALLTTPAAAVALILYFTKRRQVARALELLMRLSLRFSLGDFQSKLDRLAGLNMDGKQEATEASCVLGEIKGQILGNPTLKRHFKSLLRKVDHAADPKTPRRDERKRALVSEMRERLRHLEILELDSKKGSHDE